MNLCKTIFGIVCSLHLIYSSWYLIERNIALPLGGGKSAKELVKNTGKE